MAYYILFESKNPIQIAQFIPCQDWKVMGSKKGSK